MNKSSPERGYPVPAIDAELGAAGFEVLGRWASSEFAPVAPQTERVFYAARRTESSGRS